MGCCTSIQTFDTPWDDWPVVEPKSSTNAASPENNVSKTSNVQVSLPTGTDITQFESSGRAAEWKETMSIQPPASRRSTRHSNRRPRPHTIIGGYNPPEISGQPPILPLASVRSRRGSVVTQPDEAKSHGSSASTEPDRNFPSKIDDPQGLWSASRKLSEKVKAWDRTDQLTDQLTEKTKPKFTGGFSDVSQVKLGNRVAAVKALRLTNVESGEESRMLKRLAREIYVWASHDHLNALELLGFAFASEIPYLISPLCDNGTLHEYLQNFPDANRRRLMREITEGLKYLQAPPIIHGDLKMTNVCVTGDHVAKICAFGGSRRVEQLRTGFATNGLVLATIRYIAREVIGDSQQPTLFSDVCSFACVALETMTDGRPFWDIQIVVGVVVRVVFERQGPLPEDHPGMEDAIWELLRRCWNLEPGPQMALPGAVISVFGGDLHVLLPTGTDVRVFESSGRVAGWAETMSIRAPTDSARAWIEKGDRGQRAEPRNRDRNGTAARRLKAEFVDSPHRLTPRARPLSVVGFSGPPEIPDHAPFPFQVRLEIDELRDGFFSASGKASERFKALDRTGQLKERTKPKFTGGFSEVSQAKLGDRVVAVKVLGLTNGESGEESRMLKRLAREVYVWAALDHPNVLELLGFAVEDERPCLVSPWCDNGTLHNYLQKFPEFPDAERRRLVREIAEGLKYLHLQTPSIIHGDLKTANIFLTGDHVAKISDFGSSRYIEQLRTGFTTNGLVPTTIRYSAPELLREDQNPTLFSDVFSFAYVALETMTNKCPFWKTVKDVAIVVNVVFFKQTPSPEDYPGVEEAIWELLRRCWNYEPSHRPHMVDVCTMLSAAGYGSATGFYTPTSAGPSYSSTRFDRTGHGASPV